MLVRLDVYCDVLERICPFYYFKYEYIFNYRMCKYIMDEKRIILHSFEYVLDKRVVILYYRSKISYGLLYEFLQELI